jgi:hypothetical protein
MPQIAKLPASRVMTTPITVRPSQFSEALRIPRNIDLQFPAWSLGWLPGPAARNGGKAAHYKERGLLPQPTGFTAKTPLSGVQRLC